MTTFYTASNNSIYAGNAVWATVRSASTGTLRGAVDDQYFAQSVITGGVYYIERGFLVFDTSSIGSTNTVTAATLGLYGMDKDAGIREYNIYASTCSNPVVATDFDLVSDTALCDTSITAANWSTTSYNTFVLNAAGLANISKTGLSNFSFREALKDVANVAPVVVDIGYARFYSAHKGGNFVPYLDVTISTPSKKSTHMTSNSRFWG